MLKGIPCILTPDLLKIMMEMGHGDTLVIGDGNFPAAAMAKDCKLVRLDGHGVPFFPLDPYVEAPVSLMEVVPGDPVETPIWDEYAKIVEKYEPGTKIGHIERFKFYDEAKKAYVIIATGEAALYANIILQKGVVK